MKFSVFHTELFTRRAALDAFFVLRTLENGVHENAGRVNLVRRKLADVDKLFDFGDDVIGGSGHHGIEVARGLPIDEIAPAVAFPRLDEREIAAQAAFHHVHAAIEFTRLFPFGDHSAVASGCVKRGNAGTSRAQPFAQGPLWIQFHLQFTAQDELLEEFVFADVSGDHLFRLPLLEQQADAEIIDSRVIADDGQVLRAFAANSRDKVFRDAAEAEAAHENRGAVAEFFNSDVSRGDSLVHSMLRSVRSSLLHPVWESEGGHAYKLRRSCRVRWRRRSRFRARDWPAFHEVRQGAGRRDRVQRKVLPDSLEQYRARWNRNCLPAATNRANLGRRV